MVTFHNDQRTFDISPELEKLIIAAADKAVSGEGIKEGYEIDLIFASEKRMREINRQTREIDKVTDVLSFPMGENGQYDKNPETGLLQLGDIMLSLSAADRQAREFGHSFEREVCYLSVHSVLHLLGYDHEDEKGKKEMRKKEETALAAVGLLREESGKIAAAK